MKILEYIGLDVSRVKAQYTKVREAIARDDFRQAEVKKLANLGHGKFYRAKLDYANRLLFAIVRHGDSTYALMLEVIEHHAYDKSRFLRGAAIDEGKISDTDAAAAVTEAEPVRYIHPGRREVHLLDKVISFDDAQEAIYRLPPPLIVVGSAGSGKTVLTLEKMKHAEGEVLYVTHSAYLAQSARDLYYGHGFEHTGQEVSFLSYRDFIESLRVPAGREATWRDFSGWFVRHQQVFKGIDAHQAFEEIRGVITADAAGPLERSQYLVLWSRLGPYDPGLHYGIGYPFSPLPAKQRAYLQTTIDQIHQQFIAVVREGRGKRLKETSDTFSGLFWNGEQALENGLIDHLGSLDYVAREVVKAEEVIDYTPKENVAERLAKRFGAAMGAGAMKALQGLGSIR